MRRRRASPKATCATRRTSSARLAPGVEGGSVRREIRAARRSRRRPRARAPPGCRPGAPGSRAAAWAGPGSGPAAGSRTGRGPRRRREQALLRPRRGARPTSARRPRPAARRSLAPGRASSVSGGSGSPVASMAAPPTQRLAHLHRDAGARGRSRADSITSGPMPSPGRTAIVSRSHDVLPWYGVRRRLVGGDRGLLRRAGTSSSSMPFEQAVPREGLERERSARAVRQREPAWAARSMVTAAPRDGDQLRRGLRVRPATGSRPFFSALPRKMSAKRGAMTARKP